MKEILDLYAEQHAKIRELEQWKKEARFDKHRVAEALGFHAGMDMTTENFLVKINELRNQNEFRATTIEEQRNFIGRLKDQLQQADEEIKRLKTGKVPGLCSPLTPL